VSIEWHTNKYGGFLSYFLFSRVFMI
jgi:hypothetical protein